MANYYEVLGVGKDATEVEIKKAYRSLSLTHHPDRGGDTNKFQEINEAYETLSDPSKRTQYDAEQNGIRMGGFPFGFPGGQGFPGQGFPGAQVHFTHMGGGPPEFGGDLGNFINMMFHGGIPQNIGKPIPIIRNVQISLEQAFTGVSIPIEIERWVMRDQNTRQMEKETIYISLPPGIDENEIMVLREKGNVINEQMKGDIKIVVQIQNNTQYIRRGLDLVYQKTITLKESLCGFVFTITHLNGKHLSFNNSVNNMVIKPNSKKVIPNMGMQRDGNIGNLIIDFEVQFPDTLTQEQVASLSSIL